MQIIALPRGRGKTTHVIERIIEDPDGVLVVENQMERRRIINLLVNATRESPHNLGKKLSAIEEYWDRRVMTPREALLDNATGRTKGAATRNRNVYIDNLDLVLDILFGRIEEVTINVGNHDSITTDGDE